MRISLIIITLLFLSCRKENKKTNSENNTAQGSNSAYRSKFIDTLATNIASYNDLYVSFCNSSSCFYILQKQNAGSYFLYKCDSEINLVYKKQINLGTDTVIDFCASKNQDACYILQSTNNFSMNGNPVQGYFKFYDYRDSATGCSPPDQALDYEFADYISADGENSNNNFSTLTKLNANGNEEWQKTLNGNSFTGNAIETTENGEIFVLTATRGALTPSLVPQFSSNLVGYYNLEKANHTFTIRKFDNNGNLQFNLSTTNVFESYAGIFHPSLAVSSERLYVSNLNNLYTFSLNGFLISSNKPINNTCYNYVTNVVSNPDAAMAQFNGYLQKNGSQFMHYRYELSNGINQQTDNSNVFAMDSQGNTYAFNQPLLRKYNSAGTIILNKTLVYPPANYFHFAVNTAFNKENKLYTFIIDPVENQILAFKFDDNGNFE